MLSAELLNTLATFLAESYVPSQKGLVCGLCFRAYKTYRLCNAKSSLCARMICKQIGFANLFTRAKAHLFKESKVGELSRG